MLKSPAIPINPLAPKNGFPDLATYRAPIIRWVKGPDGIMREAWIGVAVREGAK